MSFLGNHSSSLDFWRKTLILWDFPLVFQCFWPWNGVHGKGELVYEKKKEEEAISSGWIQVNYNEVEMCWFKWITSNQKKESTGYWYVSYSLTKCKCFPEKEAEWPQSEAGKRCWSRKGQVLMYKQLRALRSTFIHLLPGLHVGTHRW